MLNYLKSSGTFRDVLVYIAILVGIVVVPYLRSH